MEFCLSEPCGNNTGPDETALANNTSTNKILTDPRYRIMILNPKQTYSVVPLDASSIITYPYYSNSSANYPVLLNVPIAVTYGNAQGMMGLPDPKRFNVEFDDLRSIRKYGYGPGFDTGSFSFLIRKRFDYNDTNAYNKNNI